MSHRNRSHCDAREVRLHRRVGQIREQVHRNIISEIEHT